MSPRRTASFRRVTFLDEALDDLRGLAARSPEAAREVLRQLKWLDAGRLAATPLHDFAKIGDLSDCCKVVVVVPGHPEHRIVVRGAHGRFEVCEVVAVSDRTQDLPYLLAGLRLERLADPVRRSDAQRRIARIRRLAEPDDE